MSVSQLRDTGIKVGRYKCFGAEPQGLQRILPFNVIVGRNNAGKSALLDVLEFAVNRKRKEALTLGGQEAVIILESQIVAGDLDRITGPKWEPRDQLIGRRIAWRLEAGSQQFHEIAPEGLPQHLTRDVWVTIAQHKQDPFLDKRFARIAAERDIKREAPGEPGIEPNGTGTTKTIHYFRSNAFKESTLVEHDMLRDLNVVFEPDAHFTRIDTREEKGEWEVYLDEEQKGRIPLSRSGSGIKTVLHILAYLHLLPKIQDVAPVHYLYAFEELENNLHPAVHRRLLRYLKDTSERVGCHFFLTTHSPVEIDYFARDENAQVIHVTHDGATASVTTVSAYLASRKVLDDLDVRASDLLQSNGIIWVEGPSDRIYLNQWINLATNGELREGTHYQILEYGGSLLAHLDAGPPNEATETIHVLTINLNAALLMDSDRHEANAPLKPTPLRIIEEVKRTDGLTWVTAGRTIENYLPQRLVAEDDSPALDPFQNVIDFLRERNQTGTMRLPTDKVVLARRLTREMTTADLDTLDLKQRLNELCECIRRWNRIK